jgi:aminoglycoside phosphotransferase (APT) family kinase protein
MKAATTDNGHPIDPSALARWLQAHVPGFEGPVQLEKFSGGQSNPTYRLSTPKGDYVMRSKPGPSTKLLPSAHAIEREFRVMQALKTSGVPVPDMYALCEDESVIGRAFYIMALVEGQVFWDQSLPGMRPTERHAMYREMNRVMAVLHRLNPETIGLNGYGKSGNYFERQILRWSKQYQASVTQPIPEMDRLIEWLPAHIPDLARDERLVSVVHGDYRLDNLMFNTREHQVVAVLDWELSTLGHPLADFSYHCLSWHIAPGMFRGIAGLDLDALGIPSEAQYIDWYCEQTGFASPQQLRLEWNFYLAYNLFRLAGILQGIAKRVEEGTASSTQARASAAAARPLAQMAWRLAQRT